jgi:SpoVK/Ycf46/Vps4 family AAA+-type ATPase
MSWIDKIYTNTQNKISVVHFVETDEFSRPQELAVIFGSRKGKKILTFDAWAGLREARLENGGSLHIKFIQITDDMDTPVTDPLIAMQYMISTMQKEGTVCIFERFDLLHEKINGIPTLASALRNLIRDFDSNPVMFRNSMIVCFCNSTAKIDKDVLDHSQVYRVVGCTDKERAREVEKAIRGRREAKKWIPSNVNIRAIVDAGSGLTKIQFTTALVMAFAEQKLTPEYIASAKKLILEASGIGKIITPEDSLDPAKIGGYDEVKDILRTIARKVLNKDKAKKLGCANIRGILLFGYPGVGKTLLCKALGKMISRVIVSISSGDIFTKWYGESANKIRKIIDTVEGAGAVLFIDEIEAIVGSRSNGQGQHEETARTLGELLRYLGDYERKAMIVATTNRPDMLDFAIKRAGRFDKLIYISLPNEDARREIFKVHTNNPIDHPKVSLDEDYDLEALVEITEDFSGAEIAQVVKDACDYAFEDKSKTVTQAHFVEAVESNRPNMSDRRKEKKQFEKFSRKYCRGMRRKKDEDSKEYVALEVNSKDKYV